MATSPSKKNVPTDFRCLRLSFNEDGDMIDIFLDLPINGSPTVRISDHGLTLMRLSYSFDIDTPNKKRILNRMVSENGVQEQNSVLSLDTTWKPLYPALLQFAQLVAKLANMQLFKREVIQSMFQLKAEKAEILRSQIVTSSSWGGRRYLPYAFTEHGVAMLSSVLRSERAVEVNIAIVRTFIKLRQLLATHSAPARCPGMARERT